MTDETTKQDIITAEAEAEAIPAEAEAEATPAEAEAEATPAEAEAEAEAAPAEEVTIPQRDINELKVGMELQGKVKNIELYGAFVDVGVGKDALLHVSQLGKQNVRNVEDVVQVGEGITVYILKVDPSAGRIALSLEKPPENPIHDLKVGDVVTGKVIRIENYGAFVEVGAERPGMVHVSELATEYINSPEDKVSIGDEVRVKVIKVNRKRRQIDLSIKALEEQQQREVMQEISDTDNEEDVPTAMELALRRAMKESDDEGGSSASQADKKKRNSVKKKNALNDALQRTLNQEN